MYLLRMCISAYMCLLLLCEASFAMPASNASGNALANKTSVAANGALPAEPNAGKGVAGVWDNLMGEGLKGPASDAVILQILSHDWAPIMSEEKSNPLFAGSMPKPYCIYWGNLHKISAKMSPLQKAKAVNGFVNVQMRGVAEGGNVPYNPKWRSPRNFMKAKWGDCKDYAVMKYFAMRDMGFSSKDLRVVILRMGTSEVYHATLAVNINGEIYILDNNFRPADLILPHTKFTGDWIPLYSFNEDGAWCYNQLTPGNKEFKATH